MHTFLRPWLALFFLLPTAIFSQTQTLKGFIIDQQSETPLPGATVILLDHEPQIGTSSAENGQFSLKNVPVGRRAIRINYLGYEPLTIPNILVTAGKEVVLEIRLIENFEKMQEVVITGKTEKDRPTNELATISARQFNTEEVMRYSGGRNDVSRMAANFAGVAAANDQRNDIVIRGNSPTGVLWRLEGVPIPNPNHFSTLGTTGGPVSALNPNMLANSDFLTGAFPAEYGNATAGVFDIGFRTGNREKVEVTAQLAAFSGLEALIEGPMLQKTGGSFLVAYRHSFVELAHAVGLNIGTLAVPAYKDLSFNFDFGQTKAGRFNLFGFGGKSYIDFLGADIDSSDFFADKSRDAYNWSKLGTAGLRHNLILGEKTYWRTVVTGSFAGTDYDEFDLRFGADGDFQVVDFSEKLTDWRVSSFVNSKFSSRLTLRAGLVGSLSDTKNSVRNRENKPDLDGDGLPDWFTLRDFNGQFFTGQLFAQTQYRLTEKWTLNAGLHTLFFDLTNQFAAEPRAAINWQFHPKQRLSVGYGLHSQVQPLPVFLFTERQADGSFRPTNQHLKFTRSQHFVLGYDLKPATDWRVKTEAYFQKIDRAPVETQPSSFSILNTGADFVFPEVGSLVNDGTGQNLGLELTVEHFFAQNWYGLLTASLFDSKYEGSDGVLRNSAFNGKWVLNVLAGREFRFGKNDRRALTLDTKLTTAGGRWETPLDLAASQAAGFAIFKKDEAFSDRYDDYFRWDVKIGYRSNSARRKFSQTFFLDFQNLTNHKNIFQRRYNEVKGSLGTLYQIGFFPDILYRVEF